MEPAASEAGPVRSGSASGPVRSGAVRALLSCVLPSLQVRMGASSSAAAPAVRAEATVDAPPQGCPMHQHPQPVTGSAGWRARADGPVLL